MTFSAAAAQSGRVGTKGRWSLARCKRKTPEQARLRFQRYVELTTKLWCSPSVQEVANALSVSRLAAQEQLTRWKRLGYIEVEARRVRATRVTRKGLLYALGATGDVILPTRTAAGIETYIQAGAR